ncbi:YceD family protein [Aurantivibrio infirmus]
MSGPPKNNRIPRWVDPKKFAQQDVVLEGDIPPDAMPRLAEVIIDFESPIYAKLTFELDESRRRILTGSLSGTVNVKCQRCLEAMPLAIKTDLNLAVVINDDQAKQLPRQLEPWLIDKDASEVDLHSVLEDELLLCVPMVAYHEEACIESALYSSHSNSEEMPSKKPSPFEMLGQLKTKK